MVDLMVNSIKFKYEVFVDGDLNGLVFFMEVGMIEELVVIVLVGGLEGFIGFEEYNVMICFI